MFFAISWNKARARKIECKAYIVQSNTNYSETNYVCLRWVFLRILDLYRDVLADVKLI